VCLSVPTVVGCGGARQHIQLELTQKEKLGIQQSAKVLRETIDQVEKRIGQAKNVRPVPVSVSAKASPTTGRPIPRGAWQKVAGS
jgi:hypothetical protein